MMPQNVFAQRLGMGQPTIPPAYPRPVPPIQYAPPPQGPGMPIGQPPMQPGMGGPPMAGQYPIPGQMPGQMPPQGMPQNNLRRMMFAQ